MPNEILTRAIDAVCSGEHLTADHASAVLAEIMQGRAEPVQTGAFLVALRAKGETVPELIGLARTMRELATHVETGRDDLVDTAGAGCAVAKHGNRSSTSRSGSADVLEALGVEIELTPEQVGEAIRRTGFGFMFAPAHHAAMKHVVPVRKQLAVRTIFNFLGPLTNPAGASRQLLGVSDRRYQETIAEALAGLGCEHAVVVTADDGLDEITIAGRTRVIEVRDGGTSEWFIDPAELGIEEAGIEAIAGGDPADNAATARAILAGEQGPAADVAAINAGAAIYVGGRADDLGAGIEAARAAIDTGAAAAVLRELTAMRATGRDDRRAGTADRDR